MKKWKRVYVCSPLRADTWPDVQRNMLKAQNYMELAALKYNCRAFAPHAYLPYMLDDNYPEERALALDFGLKLLELCDALIVCGNVLSPGMWEEVKLAHKLNIPITTLEEETEAVQSAIRLTMEAVGT